MIARFYFFSSFCLGSNFSTMYCVWMMLNMCCVRWCFYRSCCRVGIVGKSHVEFSLQRASRHFPNSGVASFWRRFPHFLDHMNTTQHQRTHPFWTSTMFFSPLWTPSAFTLFWWYECRKPFWQRWKKDGWKSWRCDSHSWSVFWVPRPWKIFFPHWRLSEDTQLPTDFYLTIKSRWIFKNISVDILLLRFFFFLKTHLKKNCRLLCEKRKEKK